MPMNDIPALLNPLPSLDPTESSSASRAHYTLYYKLAFNEDCSTKDWIDYAYRYGVGVFTY